jgi:hypothetical protein
MLDRILIQGGTGKDASLASGLFDKCVGKGWSMLDLMKTTGKTSSWPVAPKKKS